MADSGRQARSRHLGLDLGGTNIKAVIVDRVDDDWQVVHRDQVPTPAADGPDAVITSMIELGGDAIGRVAEVASVGIGVPGLYDPTAGTTRFLVNIPGAWDGKPVSGPVGTALGLPATLINDARAFGLAELCLGAGRGASTMIGLTLGTGVGGVVAIDGRVHQGHDGTAGEIGHQTLEADGPECGCGNRGCLEAFARADRIAARCGAETAEEAIERARAGDPRALDGLAQVGRYLGTGIANMITVLTPDRVVIGGGLSVAFDLLADAIHLEIRRRVHTTSLVGVEIVPAALGTWAGAIGAAIHGADQVAQPGQTAAAASASAPITTAGA